MTAVRGRAIGLAAALGLALFATGCASSGAARSARIRLERQISGAGLDPQSIVYPFELSEEMRSWVRQRVPRTGSPLLRLQRLLNALLIEDRETPITYQRGTTLTAREVWASRRANCLSFTHLFVGLAREVDIPVYYLRVSDLQSFEKDGDLVVASEHVTAAYGPPANRKILDFSADQVMPYRSTEPLSDLGALALFYSNQGAEKIRQGDHRRALELLEVAVRLDPDLADGWLNRGVALRRSGRVAEAEDSYWRALESDPGATSAYYNLSALVASAGRPGEAQELLALADRRGNRNPFSFLALGDLSLREGRLAEAERYYRRAHRLFPGQAEPLAALGQWALASGRVDEAQRFLRRAEKQDPLQPRVRQLDRSLRASLSARG